VSTTTTDTAGETADVVIGGPHPDLDALLPGEPEGSHVLDLFAPADDYARAQFAVARAAPALEPDAVHDPVRLITHARVVSATPTGSLMLADIKAARTMTLGEALAWHDERRRRDDERAYLASLEAPLMGQDA
jgi:hypothetical protein